MFTSRRHCTLGLTALLGLGLAAPALHAQAWNHPTFQPPEIAPREFNFAIADGGWGGTTILFQWRESVGARTQLSLDAGFAEPQPELADTYALVGGQLGYQMARADRDLPFDVLLTAGLFAALGDVNVMRVPVGVSLGHRFPLEGRLAITPYIHPRVALDHCSDCTANGSDSDVGLNLDVGADFEFNPRLSLRLGATLGGSDLFDNDDAIGLSLAWSPARRARR